MSDNTIMISLKDAMAAAVAAQRVNGSYIKRYDAKEGELSNGALMREFLNDEMKNFNMFEADYAVASEILEYLDSKMIELIAGTLHDYWKNLVLLTEQKAIKSNDFKTLALVASVPNSYKNAVGRENSREEIRQIAENSQHIGKVGDNIEANLTIKSAVYSANYNKWYHTALTADQNLVCFPLSEQLNRDDIISISAKIHKHDDNNQTRLHYVRIKKSA
jgi:hypothetical protein